VSEGTENDSEIQQKRREQEIVVVDIVDLRSIEIARETEKVPTANADPMFPHKLRKMKAFESVL
jgi:hypothetical protein